MPKVPASRSANFAGVIFFSTFIIYWIVKSYSFAPHDFSNYYFSSYFLLNGNFDQGIFDPYLFNKKIYDEGFQNIFVSYNPNPPSVAFFFLPLALTPLYSAKMVFNIMSCSIFMLSLYRLSRHFDIEPWKIFIVVPLLFFIPIRNQILFGQTYFLIFFLISEGYLAYSSKKHFYSSLFWSIAIFIKIFPAIIFLLLLVKKEWKQFTTLVLVCGSITLICIAFQGFSIWQHYLIDILPRGITGDLHSAFTAGTQSMHMLSKYCFQYDPLFNQKPLINNSIVLVVTQGIWSAFLIATTVTASALLGNRFLAIGFTLLCGQLGSPQGSSYSLILLIIILIPLYAQHEKKILVIILLLTFIISNLPISVFQDSIFTPLRFPRLLLLILLLLLLAWYFRIIPNIKLLLACSLFLIGIKLWQQLAERDRSIRWIDTEYNSLIVDYHINNQKLFYDIWTEKGLQSIPTQYTITKISSEGVTIKNNEVYYLGKQLTHSSDNKKKANIVDDKFIIYLSDKDKGIGFYAIRKLNVP